ncbi:MAG: lysophospholipid acyltransferase family protein [Polyangiaceae bacterium]|nr:lysophospholipid acyltransferase family protein [Polyangiaceae bacterium]MCE7893533.1 hypothetical protein [Sorangiineae bacterium PRO1]
MAYAGARHGPELWLKWSPPLFGVAFALALGSARRQVRDNLRRALGKRSLVEEQLDVARTFVSYAGCLAEALGSERPEVLRARRRIRDGQLRALLAAEGGLIIGTAHFGAWDAAAPLLAKDFGRPVIVAMQAEADSEARALHDAVRARAGVRVVHVGGHPLDALPLLHHLQDGGIVAVQLDRVPRGGRAVSVPFLGRELAMPEGPFALAAIAQVPLVPLFVRRAGYLDYELGAGMPIRLPERATPAELREAAARAAGEMERSVRACPTQWFEFG